VEEGKKTVDKINPDIFVRRKLLGRKLGMTQVFDENGICTPVTVIEAGPCNVVQVKSVDKDGYDAVQIGFSAKTKNVAKPQQGHFEKAGVEAVRYLREVRLKNGEHGLTAGAAINVDIFDGVKKIDVTGISKGKGFAGTIKRWHFKQGPVSHGSMNIRQPGSVGQSSSPSRVFKGLHMSGHLGAKKATCKNLKLVKIDSEKNTILVEGAVPGPKGAFVEVSASLIKKKKGLSS